MDLKSFSKNDNVIPKTRGIDRILYDRDLCKGCGLCVHMCPRGVIAISDATNRRGYTPVEFNEDEKSTCIGCGICSMICPDYAIRFTQ